MIGAISASRLRSGRLGWAAGFGPKGQSLEHPLLKAAETVLGGEHDACRALARAVDSDDAGDWRAAKEILSDLSDDEWNQIKLVLRAGTNDVSPQRLN